MLAIFGNDVWEQLLRESLGYDPKMENGSYVDRTIMSVDRLVTWVATVVRCFLKNEKSEGQRWKECTKIYGRMGDYEKASTCAC